MTIRTLLTSTTLVLLAAACGGSTTEGSTNGGLGSGGAGGSGGAADAGACPPDAPIGKSCAGSLHCEYGTETCCGHTYPSTVCDCSGGSFACYATDACMIPPDACGGTGGAGGGPSCQADSDCAVPAVCQACPDGTSYSCAVGKCVGGACQTEFPPCPALDGGTPTTCGGFGNVPCPGIGQCIDDPSDSCDPKNGGADCPGICTCSGATIDCMPGYVFDASPAVCDCVAPNASDGGK
jgi:hypothetical protein